MSSSVIDSKKSAKIALCYLLISIFCGIFSGVYEIFSHEVYSPFMIFAFAFPLVLGCLPFFVLWFFKIKKHPSLWAKNFLHSGVATLTVGSIIKGVLEIYGTTNQLSEYYWPVGVCLYLLGLIICIIQFIFCKKA